MAEKKRYAFVMMGRYTDKQTGNLISLAEIKQRGHDPKATTITSGTLAMLPALKKKIEKDKKIEKPKIISEDETALEKAERELKEAEQALKKLMAEKE